MIKTVLTIAGSDSCGGAGVQTDIKIISMLGAYAVSAVTALTAQNTLGVHDIYEIPADFIGKQIDSLADDFEIAAVKTGMLVNSDVVNKVADRINYFGLDNLVVDPVFVSKNKRRLLSDEAVKSMITRLFPKAFLVTPNILEAEMLTRRKINNIGDMAAAARSLIKLGPKNILIKGGHLGNTGVSGRKAIDILYDGKSFERFEDDFLPTKGVHGTGCIYSAAITTELAKGNDLVGAIRKSKRFISKVIAESVCLGKGYALINYCNYLNSYN